jgi:6-phospho-beta-glucosidase
MKVTVIGSGSTYTPELVDGFLRLAGALPLNEICLMDIDSQRLHIVGNFAQRMVEAQHNPFQVTLTTDLRAAVAGAAYVITQLRVGLNIARREDEYLGRRHGLVGQETTGVGGMAKALRTIPVILEIANTMQELAPGALLANFTNPAGLVTEALTRYASDILSVGVCNAGITMKMNILETLEKKLGRKISSEKAILNTLGLNHLSWHRGFTVDGEELWQVVFEEYLAMLHEDAEPDWNYDMVKTLGMIPNYYLHYFYETHKVIAEQTRWPPSRAEQVMEIEKRLLEQYADPSLEKLPEDLMKRGGAYYSTLATELIQAHYNNLSQVHVVNIPNHGAVPDWPDDWVLEMPCQVDAAGIHPLPAEPLPPVCFGLVAQVKMYELLTVEAAVHGDRKALFEALLCHPLGPAADQVETVMDDILSTNRAFLPQFA